MQALSKYIYCTHVKTESSPLMFKFNIHPDLVDLSDGVFCVVTGLCLPAQKLCLLKEVNFNKWKDREKERDRE